MPRGSISIVYTGHSIFYLYSTNHVYLHRPNAFGFWQTRLHLCYETLKRVSNFSEYVICERCAGLVSVSVLVSETAVKSI